MKLLTLITLVLIVYAFSGKLADFGSNAPLPEAQEQQQEQIPFIPVEDPYRKFKEKIDTLNCDMLFKLRDKLLRKHVNRKKKSNSYLNLILFVVEKTNEKSCEEKYCEVDDG